MPELQPMMPELFVWGGYAPDKRMGPALWLRCIEARVVDGVPPAGTTPVFYLPGISREKLAFAMDLKNNRRGRIKEYADKYKSAIYSATDKKLDHNWLNRETYDLNDGSVVDW